MIIINKGKSFVEATVTQNEVVDREQYIPGMGQVQLLPIFFTGAGAMEVSGNSEDFFAPLASAYNQNTLMPTDVYLPRYLRITGAGTSTIFFYAK